MMKHMMVWLLQVTYADTHPMFSSTSYPHFFRVVPSDNEFNEPRLALLKQYNWTRVGTLYQNQARYSLVSGDTPQESCSIAFPSVPVPEGIGSCRGELLDRLQEKREGL